jgi:hypothetical protein
MQKQQCQQRERQIHYDHHKHVPREGENQLGKKQSGAILKGHPLPSRPAPLSYEYLSDRITVKRASHSRFHLIAHACEPSIPSSVRQHQKHNTQSTWPCLSAKPPLLVRKMASFTYQVLSDESSQRQIVGLRCVATGSGLRN